MEKMITQQITFVHKVLTLVKNQAAIEQKIKIKTVEQTVISKEFKKELKKFDCLTPVVQLLNPAKVLLVGKTNGSKAIEFLVLKEFIKTIKSGATTTAAAKTRMT